MVERLTFDAEITVLGFLETDFPEPASAAAIASSMACAGELLPVREIEPALYRLAMSGHVSRVDGWLYQITESGRDRMRFGRGS